MRHAPRRSRRADLRLAACLALLCSGAFADCRQASGGRFHGLDSHLIWHARLQCGAGALIWFRTLAGEGPASVWRVDDLLIIPDMEPAQTLSLGSSLDVECRHRSDPSSLVFALGEWNPRAGQGERQPISRAWRVDPATRKVEELPARDVSCVIR